MPIQIMILKNIRTIKKNGSKNHNNRKRFYRLEGRFNEIQVIKSDLQILDKKN